MNFKVMEDFLSEETVLSLREWIKSERRFATAIEAANRGVKSIGEDEPLNSKVNNYSKIVKIYWFWC